jgi:hypothetical protein
MIFFKFLYIINFNKKTNYALKIINLISKFQPKLEKLYE